ncbi:hypothetical protein M501DRAFT_999288 [Patellaria atrata CBS 101060]|uniref:Histone deacetylase complex subunit SAP30 Sin3 binding domain-containing protein n=1 Tax=Patellaria atrata CBS 101060 TaxID=1346257 RepID=A0A9P4VN29_9PEZI|nr:hypothetical protein M501DRAFT_999288 [Patellaria atrata CBS 101060]
MPPAKIRVQQDDSKPEPPFLKEKSGAAHLLAARGRRNGHNGVQNGSSLKEVMTTEEAATMANGDSNSSLQNGTGRIPWASEDPQLLQSYRSAYGLDTPSSFKGPLSHIQLSHGIGPLSPTMARKRAQRRVRKEQLALAVRKNFNALAVNENEVIVDFLYKVKSQDKAFRMHFGPQKLIAPKEYGQR